MWRPGASGGPGCEVRTEGNEENQVGAAPGWRAAGLRRFPRPDWGEYDAAARVAVAPARNQWH